MYKDIITYQLADGIDEKHLLDVASQIIESWMKEQEGFIGWEIHKNSEESYTDVVYWESEECAKKSEKNMGNIPNGADWFACYDRESMKCINASCIARFHGKETCS